MKSFENIKLSANRKFGFFFASVFALLGTYFLIDGLNSTAYVLFAITVLFLLAMDGILNHSVIPLQIASYTGFFVTAISIVLVIIYFIGKLIYGPLWNAGFATTTILILISIGLNGLFLGIIGEYIGRIYKQVKDSPLTIIEERINI